MVQVDSDKHYWHRYTDVYKQAFGTLGRVSDILEFGILEGASIRWLAELFPEARIVGADIVPPRQGWPQIDRIQYAQVDQDDRSAIHALFRTLGRNFDLVIEDGSHIPRHQASCLVESLPWIRPSGVYILEDVHTSHPDNAAFAQYSPAGQANCLHTLLAIQHLKDCHETMTAEIARDLESSVFFSSDDVLRLFSDIDTLPLYKRTSLPLRCYRCGQRNFDYRRLLCRCGAELYSATDSMSFIIRKR
jgi:hypothetical protein